jgi:bacteriorhodopsin
MESLLMIFNTFVLLTILVSELKTNLKNNIDIQKASSSILSIASTQYAISLYLYQRYPTIAQEIRYIDWLMTTPLLLFTYWKLAKNHGYKSKFEYLGISVVLMVSFGYIAEKNRNSYKWFILSIIPYLFILNEIMKIQEMFIKNGMTEYSSLGNFFIYGWTLYPLAFYASDKWKFILYSLGDFINKGVYSIMLYEILKKEDCVL